MSTKLNREAYEELIRGDLAALEPLPDSLERAHIEHVLHWSIGALYPEASQPNRGEYAISPALEPASVFREELESLARSTEWATRTELRGPRPGDILEVPEITRRERWGLRLANWREVITHYWRHDRPLWLEALTITLAAGAIVGLVFLVFKVWK